MTDAKPAPVLSAKEEYWTLHRSEMRPYVMVRIARKVRTGEEVMVAHGKESRCVQVLQPGYLVGEFSLLGSERCSLLTAREFEKSDVRNMDQAAPAVPKKDFPAGTTYSKDRSFEEGYCLETPRADGKGSTSLTVMHYSLHAEFNAQSALLIGPDVEKTYEVFARLNDRPLRGIILSEDTAFGEAGGFLFPDMSVEDLYSVSSPKFSRLALRPMPEDFKPAPHAQALRLTL